MILIIDDDDKLRALLVKYLQDNNFECLAANDTLVARKIMEIHHIDIIILDVMMPGESGINFAAYLKNQKKSIPILMLSALGDAESRITGLEVGADDYLSKPFEPKELLLRIQKLLTRISVNTNNTIRFGEFSFNLTNLKLYRNQELIELSSTEANLLKTLASKPNHGFNREELARYNYGISDRSIDVQIVRLRQKIEIDPRKPQYIITIRNQGYGLFI